MFTIKNLTYKYEKKNEALKSINMDFSKGNIVGIIGSNGSGKSTLFMNLVGVLRPTRGEILYNGKILDYSKRGLYNIRKNVGIVFQDPDKQIFYSKVYDDVAFSLRNIGFKEDEIDLRVRKSLQSVNALDLIDKPIHFLSYGQKKRVAIASVIAMENEVVLLDEPTSGLDPISTKAIIEILTGLSKRGVKVVISSHDMDLIYDICDYVYILNKGSVVREGSCMDVFNNEDIIINAGLNIPWLVKIHKNMNLPLFKTENELYDYYKNSLVEINSI